MFKALNFLLYLPFWKFKEWSLPNQAHDRIEYTIDYNFQLTNLVNLTLKFEKKDLWNSGLKLKIVPLWFNTLEN